MLFQTTIPLRFWRKVYADSFGCWLWQGAITTGYGRFASPRTQLHYAHRFAYERLVGPVPDGLTLDHLCRVRACVNPRHLDAVPMRTNLLRGIGIVAVNAKKTHCINGHALDLLNTYRMPRGRACKTCRYAHKKAWRQRQARLGLPYS